jgi:hypothetical protein
VIDVMSRCRQAFQGQGALAGQLLGGAGGYTAGLKNSMNFTHLADSEYRYTRLDFLDYGAGGQFYGALEGSVTGERLNGTLRLTNLAMKRPDDINLPTVRGILETADGARIYVANDGIARARPSDGARIIASTMTFRTGDERYSWLNTTFVVAEGILDIPAVGGVVRQRLYVCEPTIELPGDQ